MAISSPDKQQAGNKDTQTNQERQLLTVDQAADYLQLSASSIRSYIRQGKLKGFRLAGRRKVLIALPELLALREPTPSCDTQPGHARPGR